ncbi:hypothetical protein BDW75DRAFT_57926 [Aspergillus navahoensis]
MVRAAEIRVCFTPLKCPKRISSTSSIWRVQWSLFLVGRIRLWADGICRYLVAAICAASTFRICHFGSCSEAKQRGLLGVFHSTRCDMVLPLWTFWQNDFGHICLRGASPPLYPDQKEKRLGLYLIMQAVIIVARVCRWRLGYRCSKSLGRTPFE